MKTKSGNELFPIGIGTWLIGGTYDPDPTAKYKGAHASYDNEEAEIEAICYSISQGQNHIDTAELYGAFHTDEVGGKAIKGHVREELYIADKLWKHSVGKNKVRPTVDQMLDKLGTDYLDMLYIHAPFEDAPWQEAIPQINELIDEGIVRDFGVSNFTIDDMKYTMKQSTHPIVANQMNFNLCYRDDVTPHFNEYCAENNIKIIAYQPLQRKELLDNKQIFDVAKKHMATPSQIALSWLLAQNTLPIPKAVSRTHIDENIGSINIQLSSDDLDALGTI